LIKFKPGVEMEHYGESSIGIVKMEKQFFTDLIKYKLGTFLKFNKAMRYEINMIYLTLIFCIYPYLKNVCYMLIMKLKNICNEIKNVLFKSII